MGAFCRKSEVPRVGSGTREVAGEHRNESGDASILIVMIAADKDHAARLNAHSCDGFLSSQFCPGLQRLHFHVKSCQAVKTPCDVCSR
jgi:hypothetical protein